MKKLFPALIVLISLTMTGCLVEDNSAAIAELKKELSVLNAMVEEKNAGLLDEEIAELIIHKDLETKYGAWGKRLSSMVWVSEKDNDVTVTITAANGEGEIENSDLYYKDLLPILESSVKKIKWLEEPKITLQVL